MVNRMYVALPHGLPLPVPLPPVPYCQGVLFRRLMAELACRSTCHGCGLRKHALWGYGDNAYCRRACWLHVMDACGCNEEWCDTCFVPCLEGGGRCLIKG